MIHFFLNVQVAQDDWRQLQAGLTSLHISDVITAKLMPSRMTAFAAKHAQTVCPAIIAGMTANCSMSMKTLRHAGPLGKRAYLRPGAMRIRIKQKRLTLQLGVHGGKFGDSKILAHQQRQVIKFLDILNIFSMNVAQAIL